MFVIGEKKKSQLWHVLCLLMKQDNNLNINIMGRTAAGYWKDKKEKLLKRYNNLTEKDLRFSLGQEKDISSSPSSRSAA